jgi:predicted HicB family RNase H-like nuclease
MAMRKVAWINVRMASRLRDEIREVATRDEQSMSEWVRQKVIERLKEEQKQKEQQMSSKT